MIPEIAPRKQIRAVFAPCVNHEFCRAVTEICHDMNRTAAESKDVAVLNVVEENIASTQARLFFSKGNHFLYKIRDDFLRLTFRFSAPVSLDSVNPAGIFFFACDLAPKYSRCADSLKLSPSTPYFGERFCSLFPPPAAVATLHSSSILFYLYRKPVSLAFGYVVQQERSVSCIVYLLTNSKVTKL